MVVIVTVPGVANGRRALGRLEAALGVVGVLTLILTYVLITGSNPFTGLAQGFRDWLASGSSLSKPATAWAKRIDATPTGAILAGATVVVTMRGTVEAYDANRGDKLWSRDAEWGAVGGADSDPVVLVGRGRGHGFEVVNPADGEVRWSDGSAVGVWTYRDTILTLTCPSGAECTLVARAPATGASRWTLRLPGSGATLGRALSGANPELPAGRDRPAAPGDLPAVLGFAIDGRVQAVETAGGTLLRQVAPTDTTRVVVMGGRHLVIAAVPAGAGCRYSVEARDPASGASAWRRDGYDLGTASGVGCTPSHDPAGSDPVLAGIRGDNRAVYLSARTGQELYVAGPGEALLSTDGRYGIVRSADRTQISGVDLQRGGILWSHAAGTHHAVALTRWAVLITDSVGENGAGRLVALEPGSGSTLADVATHASVLSAGPTGLVLSEARTVGFLAYGSGVA